MRRIDNESDMPMFQKPDKDRYIEHIKCDGSRRHVLSWDTNGTHCSEPKCEINKPNPKINIGTIGHAGQGRKTIHRAILESLDRR